LSFIKSISGFRGTIGGKPGDNFTPIDIVASASGYGAYLKRNTAHPKIVIGRDGRLTGPLVQSLVVNTLLMMGIDVIDAGLSTTPTIEMGVIKHQAQGGIIITASHNPMNWNALKLLNSEGEFLSADDAQLVLKLAESKNIEFAGIDELGLYGRDEELLDYHIDKIMQIPYLDLEGIREANYFVVVDAVNSSGSFSIGRLLERIGVRHKIINGEINGRFAHNPEPLAKHLTELAEIVVSEEADCGIAVDPDVDRVAFMQEDGKLFGEEYTLVAISDMILSKKAGPTVSNLSSSRALADVTASHGESYFASAVGEVNVVAKMKEVNAVIGGEGNGGVILPDLHYGRDALVGIALFLSYMQEKSDSLSSIRSSLPDYFMAKNKADLPKGTDTDAILSRMHVKYADNKISTIDGVKIEFEDCWVHLRKSNTEPIIRIYTEAKSKEDADALAERFTNEIEELLNQ
jgi:phosphomannomutase